MSDSVLISLITGGAGIVMAFISVVFKRQKPKKGRIDTALDVYEALIKQLYAENERKDKQIALLDSELKSYKGRE